MTSPWPSPPPPPGPPPAGPHPTGELVVHVRTPLGGGSALMNPLLTIDGYPAPLRWGRNAFVAPAGPRQLRASTRYLFTYGSAQDVVPVHPGRSTEVHYSPPAFTFLAGRMGPVPQPRAGQTGFWVLMALLGLALLLGLVGLVGDLLG